MEQYAISKYKNITLCSNDVSQRNYPSCAPKNKRANIRPTESTLYYGRWKKLYIEGLDVLDNQILNVIKNNARMSYSDIGEKVGVSRVSVKKRMEAME